MMNNTLLLTPKCLMCMNIKNKIYCDGKIKFIMERSNSFQLIRKFNNSCIYILFVFFYVILCLKYYINFDIYFFYLYNFNIFVYQYHIHFIFYVVSYFFYRILIIFIVSCNLIVSSITRSTFLIFVFLCLL